MVEKYNKSNDATTKATGNVLTAHLVAYTTWPTLICDLVDLFGHVRTCEASSLDFVQEISFITSKRTLDTGIKLRLTSQTQIFHKKLMILDFNLCLVN